MNAVETKMKPDLHRYFKRIGFKGEAKADLATLQALHRAHVLAVPYENLDVYLERPVDQDIDRIFHKIVAEGRGGWCYEMNGLLGWALREIGFDVTRRIAGVFRAEFGDAAFGNHLIHTVELGVTYVVDVGIGDFIKEPTVLREGSFVEEGKTYRLERLADDSWRFHNIEGARPPSFDFFFSAADEALLSATCATLQSDPESMFRQNLICQQMTSEGFRSLIGRRYTDTADGPAGLEGRLIESEDELHQVIMQSFSITPPDLGGLWEKVCARHEELFEGS
jgi:N-hydroxyarylamine O-acetyltransferase